MLVVFADKKARSTRPDKHIRALLEAGAEVIVLGNYPRWLEERLSPIGKISFVTPRYLQREYCSENKIWLIRVALNLTWHKLEARYFPNYTKLEHMLKLSKKYKPHVVLCFNPTYFRVARKIAQKCNARLVYDSGEFWPGYAKHPFWKQNPVQIEQHLSSEKECIAATDMVVTTSGIMSERLNEYYGIENTVTFLNSQEDIGGLAEAAVQYPIKFVFHGMLGADRNVKNLIIAMRELENCTLDLYGDFYTEDDKRGIVEEISKDLEGRVTLHGPFSGSQIKEFLPKYDIGVYPAIALDDNFNVTLPNKLFDCIVHGLALAVPKFDSIVQIIDRENNGWIIDTSSPESMRDDFRSLIELPEEVARMKEASRVAADRYSRGAQAHGLVEAYQRMLST